MPSRRAVLCIPSGFALIILAAGQRSASSGLLLEKESRYLHPGVADYDLPADNFIGYQQWRATMHKSDTTWKVSSYRNGYF